MMDEQLDIPARAHHVIIRTLIDSGAWPSNAELQRMIGVDEATLRDALRELEEIHGVALHPSDGAPWVIHPFSSTPTGTYVEGRRHGWWAPCLWCGLGVAALVGGDVRIHSRIGGGAEPIAIDVQDGRLAAGHAECHVHFAIPPRDAWKNVHAHCAMLLPFHAEKDARAWSTRHGLPFGEVITLDQTAVLAKAWYGHHADPDWHKWTIAEAQSILAAAGLRSPFWSLGDQSGRF